MAAEKHETSNGWPLGLQIISRKIRFQCSAPAVEPRSSNLSSSSFSSVSSSNLDTESSTSFFEDNSVSLGKLMGFRQRERGSIRAEPAVAVAGDCDCEGVSRGDCGDLCGLPVAVMVGSLVKMTRKSK